VAFWLRAPAPPDLGELAASPNRDVCRWDLVKFGLDLKRWSVWEFGGHGVRYGTARPSTVQHGARSRELLSLRSLPIQEAARARLSHLSLLTFHLSPLTSHLPIFRQTATPPVGDPAERSSPLLSPFPSIFSTSRSRATHKPSPMQLRDPSAYYGTSPYNNTEISRRFPWRRRRRPQKAKLPCLIGRSPAT
jgi:hypothetical protein